MMSSVVARESSIAGQGSFATQLIKRGEVIKILGGERITDDEMQRRIAAGEEGEDDSLQVGDHEFLDLEESARLFNHSCDPNAGIRHTSELFALRDITPGEEITYDYSTTVGAKNKYPWSMQCLCASPKCRGQIGDVLTIPAEVLRVYWAATAFPDFIRAQLSPLHIIGSSGQTGAL